MKSSCFLLSLLFLFSHFALFSQKLKKSDRLIVSNLQLHESHLGSQQTGDRVPGSDGEKIASMYVTKQFERWGLRPQGDANSWLQTFVLHDGKEVLPATRLVVNDSSLILFREFFPFPFSASKKTEAAVAMALAEDGVPWFKDLNDIAGDESVRGENIADIIRAKAIQAASKGATALVIYNTSGSDLVYDEKDTSTAVSIPVVYITKNAFSKYCGNDAAIVDIKINTALKEKKRITNNIAGFADNGRDSTIIVSASMADKEGVAALLELVRLMKGQQKKSGNYLFIAYSAEQHGKNGAQYFNEHPLVNMSLVNYNLRIDNPGTEEEKRNGLLLVKDCMSIIQNK